MPLPVQALAEASPSQFRDAPELPPDPPPPPQPGVSGSAAPQIAAVYTTEQFQRALYLGIRDIEIRSHLDFRNLRLDRYHFSGDDAWDLAIGVVGRTTRSIRVRTRWSCPAQLSHMFSNMNNIGLQTHGLGHAI